MGDRVERLREVHKAHIEWLLVLACLVHQYSEICDLISCPPSLSKSRLFICNFRFSLNLDPFSMIQKRILLAWETRAIVLICSSLQSSKYLTSGLTSGTWPIYEAIICLINLFATSTYGFITGVKRLDKVYVTAFQAQQHNFLEYLILSEH